MNKPPFSSVAMIALLIAILTIIVVVLSSMGFRMEWWGYGSSLKILRAAVVGGVTAIVLSVLGIFMTWPGRGRRGFVISIIALLIVGATLTTPLYWSYSKSKLPPIQDISTDLETPPEFWDAPTSRIYPGIAVAKQQLAAYPDIQPVTFSSPMDQVFEQAVALVEERELDGVTIEHPRYLLWPRRINLHGAAERMARAVLSLPDIADCDLIHAQLDQHVRRQFKFLMRLIGQGEYQIHIDTFEPFLDRSRDHRPGLGGRVRPA